MTKTTSSYMRKADVALIGAICLLVGWGSATVLHEMFHFLVAYLLGIEASFEYMTLSTGSVFVYGEMTPLETTFVAIAGSIGLVIVGVMLVEMTKWQCTKMIGVIFLCRAWVDTLPICGMDGGLVAGSAGYGVAVFIVIVEVLICGGGIFSELYHME